MKLHGRIPVEPLDDERLTNIERRVVAGAGERALASEAASLGRSRKPLVLVGAACALAAAALFGWKLRAPEMIDPPVAIASGDKLAFRSDGSSSTIDIGDATIESGPDTVFRVTRPDGGVLVDMTRGKVSLSVGKRHDRPPLIVRAGSTDVVVVGTRFTVDYGDGSHDVDVRVTEGVVKVLADHHETRVAAGDHWHTDRGLVATAEPETKPTTPTTPVTPTTPAHATPTITDPHVAPVDVHLHGHVASIPEPARPTPAVRHTTPAATPPRTNPLVSARDPHRDLKADLISQAVEPAMDIGVKDIAEAMSRYRILVLGEKNETAAAALYSMAVTQHLKLGRDGDALRSIEAYTRAYPAGRDLRAALWLRVRILCRVAIDDQCRAAAVQYRRVAGDLPAARVAERIATEE